MEQISAGIQEKSLALLLYGFFIIVALIQVQLPLNKLVSLVREIQEEKQENFFN